MDTKPGITSDNPVFWILRIGVAMEFIGHGVLGLGHPPAWASYFGVVGIGHESAYALMPWVGAFDIAMAAAVLFYPIRAVIWYMAIWGLWTALLRPLAGESVWEAVERAGNYGAPFALFLLAGGGGLKAWLGFQPPDPLPERKRREICWVLRLTTALLLFGHGALGLLAHKPLYSTQYAFIGLHGAGFEPLIGGFECALALAVLMKPVRGLLVGVVLWKLASEALNPIAGSPIWVFIEHGGSYAAPLALAYLTETYDKTASRLGGGAIA
jgi:uncharacterized membrane protein YphA (DoxX/SURF4 family)